MLEQKKYHILIFTAIFVFIGGIFVFSFLKKEEEQTNIHQKTAELYFNDTATSKLRAEEKTIQANTPQQLVFSLLEQLKQGSKIEGHATVVPADIAILNVEIEKNTATIDLSKEYNNLSFGGKILCRCAIVWSVTSLDFIENVCIKVEGQELKKTSGEKIGLMNRDNTKINPDISPESKRYEIVTLYFADKTGNFAKEEREIEISQIQTREKAVVEQLIIGAKEAGHISTLPSDIKIRNVTTTKEGICYVDFSNDSINKMINGSISEQIAVYSVVNSIVSLYNVEKVQFLIEGEKIEETMGHLDYTKPFEKMDV